MTAKRIAAWLLAASLAVGVLAGCGTKEAVKPADTTPVAPVVKTEPQTLNLNLGSEPPQMDSVLATDSSSFTVLEQIMEGLVRLDADGKAVQGSGSAASWKASADGLTYTFTMKDGLKWSDGQPLTAKDFAYSWMRALDPKVGSQYNFILFYIKGAEDYSSLSPKDADFATKSEDLKKKVGISTPDDKTLVVTLARPTAYFINLTNFPTYFPQRKDVVEKFADKYALEAASMVFNGPFTMKTWTHQSDITLAKNPAYWDAGKVKLTDVSLKMIKDSNTYINMFEANQLDNTGIPGTLVAQYQDKPGFVKMVKPRASYLEFNHSSSKKYLGNVHIRRAFSLAIDRDGFASGVLRDGSVAADGQVPGSIALGDNKYRKLAGPIISTKLDVAAAQKELAAGLKELGLDKLPAIELMGDDSDLGKKFAQGVQGMISQNLPGVTVTLLPQDFKTRLAKMRAGTFDVVFASWGADYDDPMTFMDMWIKNSPYNDGKWYNAEYDKLIADANNTADQAKRLDDFKKAEQILMDEMPVSPVYFNAVNSIDKSWLKGMIRYPMGPSWDLKYVSIAGRQQ